MADIWGMTEEEFNDYVADIEDDAAKRVEVEATVGEGLPNILNSYQVRARFVSIDEVYAKVGTFEAEDLAHFSKLLELSEVLNHESETIMRDHISPKVKAYQQEMVDKLDGFDDLEERPDDLFYETIINTMVEKGSELADALGIEGEEFMKSFAQRAVTSMLQTGGIAAYLINAETDRYSLEVAQEYMDENPDNRFQEAQEIIKNQQEDVRDRLLAYFPQDVTGEACSSGCGSCSSSCDS